METFILNSIMARPALASREVSRPILRDSWPAPPFQEVLGAGLLGRTWVRAIARQALALGRRDSVRLMGLVPTSPILRPPRRPARSIQRFIPLVRASSFRSS